MFESIMMTLWQCFQIWNKKKIKKSKKNIRRECDSRSKFLSCIGQSQREIFKNRK